LYNDKNYICHKPGIFPAFSLNSYKNAKLCVSLLDLSYEDFQFVASPEDCEKGFKVCGKQRENYLCLKEDKTCPLTNLQVIKSKSEEFSKLTSEIKIPLNDSEYLIYSKDDPTKELPIELSWNFLSTCLDPKKEKAEKIIRNNPFNFLTEMVTKCEQIDGETDDVNWTAYDSYNLFDWLQENVLEFKKVESNDYFNFSYLDQPIQLIQRGYAFFNTTCKIISSETVSFNFLKMRSIYQDSINNKKELISVSIGLLFLAAFLSFSYAVTLSGSNCSVFAAKCLWGINLFLFSIISILLGISLPHLKINPSEESEFEISEKCFDKTTLIQIKNVLLNNSESRDLLIISFVLSLSCVAILIMIYFWCWPDKDDFTKGKSNQSNNRRRHDEYDYLLYNSNTPNTTNHVQPIDIPLHHAN
jgi:hypothetical protein